MNKTMPVVCACGTYYNSKHVSRCPECSSTDIRCTDIEQCGECEYRESCFGSIDSRDRWASN